MTTEQRRAVRQGLIDAGFERKGYGKDEGDGVYSEQWAREDNVVVIYWGVKTIA